MRRQTFETSDLKKALKSNADTLISAQNSLAGPGPFKAAGRGALFGSKLGFIVLGLYGLSALLTSIMDQKDILRGIAHSPEQFNEINPLRLTDMRIVPQLIFGPATFIFACALTFTAINVFLHSKNVNKISEKLTNKIVTPKPTHPNELVSLVTTTTKTGPLTLRPLQMGPFQILAGSILFAGNIAMNIDYCKSFADASDSKTLLIGLPEGLIALAPQFSFLFNVFLNLHFAFQTTKEAINNINQINFSRKNSKQPVKVILSETGNTIINALLSGMGALGFISLAIGDEKLVGTQKILPAIFAACIYTQLNAAEMTKFVSKLKTLFGNKWMRMNPPEKIEDNKNLLTDEQREDNKALIQKAIQIAKTNKNSPNKHLRTRVLDALISAKENQPLLSNNQATQTWTEKFKENPGPVVLKLVKNLSNLAFISPILAGGFFVITAYSSLIMNTASPLVHAPDGFNALKFLIVNLIFSPFTFLVVSGIKESGSKLFESIVSVLLMLLTPALFLINKCIPDKNLLNKPIKNTISEAVNALIYLFTVSGLAYVAMPTAAPALGLLQNAGLTQGRAGFFVRLFAQSVTGLFNSLGVVGFLNFLLKEVLSDKALNCINKKSSEVEALKELGVAANSNQVNLTKVEPELGIAMKNF